MDNNISLFIPTLQQRIEWFKESGDHHVMLAIAVLATFCLWIELLFGHKREKFSDPLKPGQIVLRLLGCVLIPVYCAVTAFCGEENFFHWSDEFIGEKITDILSQNDGKYVLFTLVLTFAAGLGVCLLAVMGEAALWRVILFLPFAMFWLYAGLFFLAALIAAIRGGAFTATDILGFLLLTGIFAGGGGGGTVCLLILRD